MADDGLDEKLEDEKSVSSASTSTQPSSSATMSSHWQLCRYWRYTPPHPSVLSSEYLDDLDLNEPPVRNGGTGVDAFAASWHRSVQVGHVVLQQGELLYPTAEPSSSARVAPYGPPATVPLRIRFHTLPAADDMEFELSCPCTLSALAKRPDVQARFNELSERLQLPPSTLSPSNFIMTVDEQTERLLIGRSYSGAIIRGMHLQPLDAIMNANWLLIRRDRAEDFKQAVSWTSPHNPPEVDCIQHLLCVQKLPLALYHEILTFLSVEDHQKVLASSYQACRVFFGDGWQGFARWAKPTLFCSLGLQENSVLTEEVCDGVAPHVGTYQYMGLTDRFGRRCYAVWQRYVERGCMQCSRCECSRPAICFSRKQREKHKNRTRRCKMCIRDEERQMSLQL